MTVKELKARLEGVDDNVVVVVEAAPHGDVLMGVRDAGLTGAVWAGPVFALFVDAEVEFTETEF